MIRVVYVHKTYYGLPAAHGIAIRCEAMEHRENLLEIHDGLEEVFGENMLGIVGHIVSVTDLVTVRKLTFVLLTHIKITSSCERP